MRLPHLKREHPNLREDGPRKTSHADADYNCIAWAAGFTDRWWWPTPVEKGIYWPEDAPRERTVDGFVAAFVTLGYQPTQSDGLEPGFEKVAIYVDLTNRPTHMARQLSSGRWTSKMGKAEDISHKSLWGLEGPRYGRVAVILKRPKRAKRTHR